MIYDFIIVGSGPAGSISATRLARTAKAPNVLLLEAGSSNGDMRTRVLADRFTTLMTHPALNWGYKPIPQGNMAGRELDYARGKGLGGSSNINFACYTVGPEDDYDEWARLVGDEAFNWESACRRRHTIEVYHLEGADDYQRYAKPSPSDHGHAGPLNIDFARSWERGLVEVLDAAQEHGFGLNLDINLDNPLGIGVVPSIAHRGVRSTAASAFLVDPPPNLTMITNAVVTKIHFVGKKAVGVVARGEDCE
ncbi:hypothetical protein LTR66_005557 [Elasticomyces elasticus]|nr:hypothetical protein LTR66_005557 [Elasticomyces elasticus]